MEEIREKNVVQIKECIELSQASLEKTLDEQTIVLEQTKIEKL